MTGHTISTYNDIRMKDIEFLRRKYAATGLSIRQKEKADISDFIEDILRSKGYGIERTTEKGNNETPQNNLQTNRPRRRQKNNHSRKIHGNDEERTVKNKP